MPQPTVLRVARRGSRWHFFLIPPGELLLRAAAHPAFEAEIDPDLLVLLCNQMVAAVHTANASPKRNDQRERRFIQIGRALFTALFPDDALRQHLRNLDTPLLIISDDREVPWECLYVLESEDPSGFLGLRADVGRGLVTTNVPNLPVIRRRKRWRCLVIANPTRDLDASEEEALQLEKWFLQRGFYCRLLCGDRATMEAVVGELLDEWDIIHFSCHVDPDSSSLLLHDGMLAPRAIQPLLRGSPIAFINGCESASVEMLTEAFIRGGVQAVIGSLYQLPPSGAAAFSQKFYESVLGGDTLGSATRAARQHVFKNMDSAAWPGFVLFGDPCLKAQVDRDPLEEALRRIGLAPESFDPAAASVVREAYRFGHPAGAITSACILGGLLALADPLLLERLKYFRVPVDALNSAFGKAFAEIAETEGPTQPVAELAMEFSKNAADWLRAAQECDGPVITREGIYRGWIRVGGGGAGNILQRLGVPLASLNPDQPFPPALVKIGLLEEADCAPSAWRLLQLATGMAMSSGTTAVSSIHIAAAMQAQPTNPLSKRLGQVGERLDLRKWLPRGNGQGLISENAPCSQTVTDMLKLASRKAQGEGRPVQEEDLLEAFFQSGGGAIGKALDERGIWRKLVHQMPRQPVTIQSIGPVIHEGATPEAWSILVNSAEFAGNAGRSVVSTFDLLAGLQVDPAGILAQRLTRLGLRIQFRSWVPSAGPSRVFAGQAACSENSNRALLLAQASAAADSHPIDEANLLQAFVASGGGRAGKHFEEHCFPLLALTSELFVNNGALDLGRFDSDAQSILQGSIDFAAQKGWSAVTRDHLAYAMMNASGYFTSQMRADNVSPEQMGDLAYSYLSNPASTSGLQPLTTDLRAFAADLARVLFQAEIRAGAYRLISERDLASAWAESGGGNFGQALVEHGFRLRQLLDEA